MFYGSNILEEREAFEDKSTRYLSEATVLMGDFKAITRLQDTNIVSATSMLWPWLVDVERSCKLVGITRLACKGSPPQTRVRSYGNTRSCLDRIYVSHLLLRWVNGLQFSSFRLRHAREVLYALQAYAAVDGFGQQGQAGALTEAGVFEMGGIC